MDHMTLYFIPSPVGLDWTTPKSLAWSALKNRLSFQSRFIGHVFVELQCGDRHELAGMTGVENNYVYELLVNKRGFGILYHGFDGRVEGKQEISEEITERLSKADRINFTRFKMNQGQCQRLLTYLDEYKEKNVGKFYGLFQRPLYGEGSGCSAFGASFLDVAGIMNDEFRNHWSNTVNIPLKYVGPPAREEKISLIDLMLNAGEWAKENEPHDVLTYWDPDRMYKWVQDKVSRAEEAYPIMELDRVKGVILDVSELPVPSEPIWKQAPDE